MDKTDSTTEEEEMPFHFEVEIDAEEAKKLPSAPEPDPEEELKNFKAPLPPKYWSNKVFTPDDSEHQLPSGEEHQTLPSADLPMPEKPAISEPPPVLGHPEINLQDLPPVPEEKPVQTDLAKALPPAPIPEKPSLGSRMVPQKITTEEDPSGQKTSSSPILAAFYKIKARLTRKPVEETKQEKPLSSNVHVSSKRQDTKKKTDITELEKARQKRTEKREKRHKKEAEKKTKVEKKEAKKLLKERKAAEKKRANEEKKGKPKEKSHPLEQLPLVGPKLKSDRLAKEARKAEKEKAKAESEEKREPGLIGKSMNTIRGWRNDALKRLQKNTIGLEISENMLRAVQVKDNEINIFEHELPDGIIIDGILEEEEELSQEIKTFWQENKIPSKKINFSLSNRLITFKTVNIPAKEESDALQALAMQAEEIISPMDASKSTIDYDRLSRVGTNIGFQIVAADTNMVKDFARAVEKAGLYSVSCEIGALAASRSLVSPYRANAVHCIINVGYETTSIMMTSGTDVFFLRIIDIGIHNFIEAISRSLNISFYEAAQIKNRAGMGTFPTDPNLDPEIFNLSRMAMREVSDTLCQEIAQTKRHYESSLEGKQIQSWNLIGDGFYLNGLIDQIVVFTGLPNVSPIQARPGLEHVEHLEQTATAIGLAKDHTMSLLPGIEARSFNVTIPGLRRKSKINLNQSEKTAQELARQHGLAKSKYSPKLAGIFIAILILAGSYYYKNQMGIELETTTTKTTQLTQQQSTRIQSGLTPVYSGADKGTLDITASNLLVAPNWQLLNSLIRTAERSPQAADYTISNQASNFEMQVILADNADPNAFMTLLQKTPNVGTVSIKTDAVTNTSQPAVTYTIGGFTGITGAKPKPGGNK